MERRRKRKLEKKERYLLLWACVCLAVTLAGMLMPVKSIRSQGLEGANQANLKSSKIGRASCRERVYDMV